MNICLAGWNNYTVKAYRGTELIQTTPVIFGQIVCVRFTFFFYKSFNSFVLYNMKVILVLWETEGFCPYCTNIRHVVSVFGRRVNSSKKKIWKAKIKLRGGATSCFFTLLYVEKCLLRQKWGWAPKTPPLMLRAWI